MSGRGRRFLRPIAESRLGSFGNRGNGLYREELRKRLAAIGRYLPAYQLEASRTLLRLDGQYGTGAVLADVAGFVFVTRGKEYSVLDHPLVQARLYLPPEQVQRRPESQTVRSLYDCPDVPVGSEGASCRVVATHPAGKKKSPVGVTRAEVVYELFFTSLPQHAFTACDVLSEGHLMAFFLSLASDCPPDFFTLSESEHLRFRAGFHPDRASREIPETRLHQSAPLARAGQRHGGSEDG